MKDDVKKIFSKNLKKMLLEHDKTQSDLCKYMGISSATASDWCNGKKMPRADKLQSLCTWFQCDMSDLLEEKKSVETIILSEGDRELMDGVKRLAPKDKEYVVELVRRLGDSKP